MASLVLNGNTSGSVTISSPAVSGTNTLTLPANTGTVITTASTFAGTGPAFAVYLPTPQTVTAGVFTKVNLTTENFDTNSNFDATTNYRFTPTVAGYYQFNAGVYAGSVTRILANIKKNNSTNFYGTDCKTVDTEQRSRISILLYMNGTTDYVELFALLFDGTVIGENEENTFFNGFLARSA